MRRCQFCGSEIGDTVVTCRFCGETIGPPAGVPGAPESSQVITLIMGIFSFLCFPFGIVAIVLWAVHRGKVKRGLARPDSLATAGVALGIPGAVLNVVVAVLLVIGMMTFGETFARQQLAEVHRAQERYKRDNGQYATQLIQLRQYNVGPLNEMGNFFGYMFTMESDGNEWSCVAGPIEQDSGENKRHYFYVDQTGVIRFSETEDVGPDSPVYKETLLFDRQQGRSREG